ncbi:metallophosphoesterase family protein [Bermanella sp. WJH001]|uniref:metallophosphoesterase family protein n=1 Tax=Bermanella sp. WJH001 TaxID=3048005 RepID=UPI0024BEF4BD|nr:metallophosphoesterase [Bermanella sp. WJH001]MDJ1538133.1 metallophosphoesterase [Bermanella sp. WJH001]
MFFNLKKLKARITYFLMVVLVLSGCDYEVSPWSTDAECSNEVSIERNIERLKAYEQEVGVRSEYQVAIISDPQQYPGTFEDLIKHVNTLPEVDFILLTGDLADTGVKAEYEWVCKVMEKAKQPIFAVIGNHDALAFGKEIWAKVFGPEDYSFTYQNSKFIAYNDNKYEFENVPDRDWLAAEAAGDDQRDYTMVFSHIPPWDFDLPLSQELKDLGVDLGVHGHEHSFDYWQLTNVQLPHYVVTSTKKKGFGLLTINSSDYTLENCTTDGCVVAQVRNR